MRRACRWNEDYGRSQAEANICARGARQGVCLRSCVNVTKHHEGRRVEAGLNSIHVDVVDLVGPEDSNEANKVSSTGLVPPLSLRPAAPRCTDNELAFVPMRESEVSRLPAAPLHIISAEFLHTQHQGTALPFASSIESPPFYCRIPCPPPPCAFYHGP